MSVPMLIIFGAKVDNLAENLFGFVFRFARDLPIKLTVILLFAGMLTGCGNNMDDLQQEVDTIKNKYTPQIEPLPIIEPYQVYQYSVFNYRAPFTQPINEPSQEAASTGPQPDKQRRKEPLEFFPLDALNMAGTLEQNGTIWGLIQDPEGMIHRVEVGNYAGQNYGEIIRIKPDKIDLLEIISDGGTSWVEREISLSLSVE